jgi:hypothetical protein
MQSSFTFIHIESSSATPPAFPVEVYWGTIPSDGSVGYLVNPQEIEKWAPWENEFFRVHDITNADVLNCGSHPSVICNALSHALSGKPVYAKDTRQTLNLLTELFSVVDRQICEISLLDLEELFLQTLSAYGSVDNVEALAQIKQGVAEEHSEYLCGGAFEVLYYSEIWKRISLNAPNKSLDRSGGSVFRINPGAAKGE